MTTKSTHATHRNPNATPFKRSIAWLLCAAIAFPGPASAALTEISSEPLAQPASSVKPNIMLILDDSGSMEQQYTPDYMQGSALCHDAGDDSAGTITGGLDSCQAGDPPLMSPDINTQYYSPTIRYFPAINYDGTSKISMTAANTANWTSVPTDGVSPAGVNTYRRDTYDMVQNAGQVNNANLVTGYPDRVWCTAQADVATDTVLCKVNSAYSYPDATYPYGLTTGAAIKYRAGGPYVYRLNATEHCTDATLTNCSTTSTPNATYPVPAPVRYCTNNTLTTCQAKRSGSYTYPKYAGNVNPGSAAQPGQVSIANLTVTNPQADSAAGTITAILVNGVNILSGNINLAASFTANTAATAIRNAINANTGVSGYHASSNNNLVSVRFGPNATAAPAPAGSGNPNTTTTGTPSATPNSSTLQVQFVAPTYTSATATISVTSATNGAGNGVTSYTVGGTQLLMASVLCPSTAICGSSGTNRRNYVAAQLAAMITTSGQAANLNHGFTATASGSTVTVTAPAILGSAVNSGTTLTESSPNVSLTLGTYSGGATVGNVDMTTNATFGGGQDPTAAAIAFRQNVGDFARVNIVPFQDPPTNSVPSTFTKYGARSDCAGVTCSYDEEMTNFANWYSYYRSRMHMAKTAIGRAFVGITDAFRVGFITINPGGDMSNRFKAIADFTAGAGGTKDLWYQWLYKQESHGSTPLREALSRVGRYFGGVTSGINAGMSASPIQLPCQPNFAILTTDGYWNGNAGIKLDGSAIGNQDNVDSGYSKRSEARYDGGGATRTDTLSDVAMYYYKTDLRTDLADQVPVTSNDPAAHQHMTLFTVGMGLAGQLTFDQGYQSGTSADFERLKVDPASGGLNWPTPAANSETALDDLWHAAVNGRGTFFSAKDPAELSNAIAETLSSVNARVGAGAAAATSNLQPVAGDNFAFTAQYETVQWIGDIKARTIDLSTGTVASRELWAAAALLDARAHTSRNLYTFDATDIVGTGDNFNKLKSFCYPGAIGLGAYPTCTDGAGLTATEMDFFEPMTTSATPSLQPPLTQSAIITSNGAAAEATKERMVDYLRGDPSYESTGGTTITDLFRNRQSVMGDIINAQPAYVKASPFSYNTGNFAGNDPYYQEYRNTTNGVSGTRKGTVYVASNEGMLHALESDPDNNPYFQTAGIGTVITSDDTFTGTLSTSPTGGEGSERWAYVPNLVMKDMKRLADSPYTHRFFTDGSPVVGDVCFGHTTAVPCAAQSSWHTILVAGLNAGGRGYYALDVSNPDSPKGLWEVKGGTGTTCLTDVQASAGTFSEDCNIGLTFGNPLIVKRKSDGKWVVIFTSGLNNLSPGDGKGYLYVVDAETGKIIKRYSTGVGCDGVSTVAPCVAGTTNPSGFGRINAWVDNATFENMALTVYGGDLLGNIWRIQLDSTVTAVPADSVTRIATLTGPDGTAQPITTKLELGEISAKRVILVGTGKFLGNSDKSSTERQSIYAIKDEMNSVVSPTVTMTRGGAFPSSTITGFVRQDLSASPSAPTTERTVTTVNPVDFSSASVGGWFIDLPDGGVSGSGSERVNVDPILQLGTLVMPSNVPSTDTCVAGGFGWINFLDYKTGGFIPGSTGNMASTKISSSLVVGINVVQLPGGTVKTIVTTADNQQLTKDTPVAPSTLQGRRVSWRELFFE